jgi:hypothetical protein
LKLDPFYGAGQNLTSLGVRATIPVASPTYGAHAGDYPKSATLNVANTQESTLTSTGTTEYDANVTTVVGNSSSFGLSLAVFLGDSLTIGSGEKSTSETDTKVTYSDSTAVSKTKTTTAVGILADSDNMYGGDSKGHGPLPQKPSTSVFFDRKFGGFMFVDPYAPGPPAPGQLKLQPIVVRGALLKESKKSRYSDVPTSNPDHDAIGLVSRAGWMKGKDGDRFNPNDPISRAEFATMLAKAINIAQNTRNIGFSDVPATDSDAVEIAAVVNGGYMQPTSPTIFAPRANLTRQDLTYALSKAFNPVVPNKVVALPHHKLVASPPDNLPQAEPTLPVSRGGAASAVVGAMLGGTPPGN